MAIYLIIGAICAVICGVIASSKGRSVIAWIVLGFLFGWIPIVIVACLPNLKQEKARREYLDREQRRLREQIRQERMKNEAFRQYSLGRIDSHDRALGVDTRTAQQSLPGGGGEDALQSLIAATEQGSAPPGGNTAEWYIAVNGQRHGPVGAAEIRQMLQRRDIGQDTLLWKSGMSEWTPLRRVPTFTSPGRA
jgi:hypothetical protein